MHFFLIFSILRRDNFTENVKTDPVVSLSVSNVFHSLLKIKTYHTQKTRTRFSFDTNYLNIKCMCCICICLLEDSVSVYSVHTLSPHIFPIILQCPTFATPKYSHDVSRQWTHRPINSLINTAQSKAEKQKHNFSNW